MELCHNQKEKVQAFYVSVREMSKSGFPRRGIQRSFEEMIYAIMGKKAWEPTHITRKAIEGYVSGEDTRLQRAHGAFEDRLDRFERTLQIIEGPELSFDAWWRFFIKHDKTILMTRKEHGAGLKPSKKDLIPIPRDERCMFETSGFSAKIRKKVEVEWMSTILNETKK